MDPSKRLDLQRTNAVVGNTLMGRSLAVFAGLSNPVLLLGGFVWGVWAAANIKQANAGANLSQNLPQSGGDAVAQPPLVSQLELSAAAGDPPPAASGTGPILVSSISTVVSDVADASPPHVIRIWPTQRSPLPPQ
jgi:hypothetical protein